MSSKIAIFYHVYQGGNWESLYHEQILKLQTSGVYDEASHIHIGVCGNLPMPFHLLKVNRLNRNENLGFESDTLYDLWRFCKTHPDWKVLYIHSKGVSKYGTILEHPVTLWRQYLEYFVIEKWRTCVKHLENYDCVGTEWQTQSYLANEIIQIPHYSGNFWWANASYINKLNPSCLWNQRYGRFFDELWIGTGNPNKFNFYTDSELWNKYQEPITPERYLKYGL